MSDGVISAEAAASIHEWYRACGIDQPKTEKPKKASKAVKAKTTNWKRAKK